MGYIFLYVEKGLSPVSSFTILIFSDFSYFQFSKFTFICSDRSWNLFYPAYPRQQNWTFGILEIWECGKRLDEHRSGEQGISYERELPVGGVVGVRAMVEVVLVLVWDNPASNKLFTGDRSFWARQGLLTVLVCRGDQVEGSNRGLPSMVIFSLDRRPALFRTCPKMPLWELLY